MKCEGQGTCSKLQNQTLWFWLVCLPLTTVPFFLIVPLLQGGMVPELVFVWYTDHLWHCSQINAYQVDSYFKTNKQKLHNNNNQKKELQNKIRYFLLTCNKRELDPFSENSVVPFSQ